MEKKILVAGSQGVIGQAITSYFSERDDWLVTGLSRRAIDPTTSVEHKSVDLLDLENCEKMLSDQADVTHIAFAAYIEKQKLADQVAPNLAMLQNLVTTMDRVSPKLQHVTLFQGGKAYGCHLGAFKTPALETDPRHMPPNFYYDQEDFLREASQGKTWDWTAFRPEAVCGFAVGNPMNLLMVIAVYAQISKHLNLPFRFPGTHTTYNTLYQLTDADILAKATLWAGASDRTAGEIYNITNGDYFRWANIWPRLADAFGMEYAPPMPISLVEMMADKAPVWNEIIKKHGLMPHSFESIAAWGFGDFIFNLPYDNISSTIKARQHGFHTCIDTEDMFRQKIEALQAMGVIAA